MTFRERLIWTVGLNVLLPLAPVGYNAFSPAGVGWHQAIRHGEILLVSIASAAIAIAGASLANPKRDGLREVKAALIVGGVLFMTAGGFLYADNFRSVQQGEGSIVSWLSGVALIASTGFAWVTAWLVYHCGEE